jgi:hypothetical protein
MSLQNSKISENLSDQHPPPLNHLWSEKCVIYTQLLLPLLMAQVMRSQKPRKLQRKRLQQRKLQPRKLQRKHLKFLPN